MIYTPVIIPTLNRIVHLKRCIESLEANTVATQTEIFVSVDYPSSDKYKNGYENVIAYLLKKKQSNGFKAFHIYYQKKNLGPAKNFDFLFDIVQKNHKCVILSEDDNEFSINFLEYMNKCLEIFKNDARVIGICGCKETEWITNGNTIIPLQLYSPYGTAIWFDKLKQINYDIKEILLNPQKIGEVKIKNLKKVDRTLFNTYILGVLLSEKCPIWDNGELRSIDTVRSLYLHFTDKICITPSVSKARTWGNDGSGFNMKARLDLNPATKWPLDTSREFKCIIAGRNISNSQMYKSEELEFDRRNYAIENEYMKSARDLGKNLKADIGYILLKACNFDWKKARELKKRIKRQKK